MSHDAQAPSGEEVIYPESDGQPIAESTLQFDWITTLKGGLDVVFRDDADVFVAADLLWYPVEGDNTTRTAPDAMVAFGRPKGHRRSYLQWREGGVAPQVVFEVLPPEKRPMEMAQKSLFYERYGIEEYYIYDPHLEDVKGFLRAEPGLDLIPSMDGWVSPRLGIRFDLSGGALRIFGPDGRPFATYVELVRECDELVRQRAELARQRAELARQRAELARQRAERDVERLRAERLAAQLRALGIEPER